MPPRTRLPGSEPTEAEFTRQVIQYAQLHGWRVAHFRPGMTRAGNWVTPVQGDGKGWPDLFLVRKHSIVVAELKVGRRDTTPEQDAWLADLENAGCAAHVWRPTDWREIEDVLGAPT